MKEKVKKYIENLKKYFYLLKEKITKDFDNPKTQKKLVVGATIILLTVLLITGIFNSFAYYTGNIEGISIIKATVGDLYITDYDYTLVVYLENSDGTYRLTSDIPTSGYTYLKSDCLKGSKFEYNDSTKMTKATISEKEVCSIYFNLIR